MSELCTNHRASEGLYTLENISMKKEFNLLYKYLRNETYFEDDEFKYWRKQNNYYVLQYSSGILIIWNEDIGKITKCNNNISIDDYKELLTMLEKKVSNIKLPNEFISINPNKLKCVEYSVDDYYDNQYTRDCLTEISKIKQFGYNLGCIKRKNTYYGVRIEKKPYYICKIDNQIIVCDYKAFTTGEEDRSIYAINEKNTPSLYSKVSTLLRKSNTASKCTGNVDKIQYILNTARIIFGIASLLVFGQAMFQWFQNETKELNSLHNYYSALAFYISIYVECEMCLFIYLRVYEKRYIIYKVVFFILIGVDLLMVLLLISGLFIPELYNIFDGQNFLLVYMPFMFIVADSIIKIDPIIQKIIKKWK